MTNPLAILWQSVAGLYDDLFPLVGMNLIWLLLSVPIVVVVTTILLLLGVPSAGAIFPGIFLALFAPNPASVGLYNYANVLVKDEHVEFDLFWSGLRAYWRRSLALFAISVAVVVLLAVNLVFYLTSGASFLKLVAILWIYALVLWFIMMMYMNPLLVEQENKSLKLIIRNAFILAIDNLIPSIVLLIILVIISALSVALPLLVALLTGSFLALVETRAVLAYLEKYRGRMANQTR